MTGRTHRYATAVFWEGAGTSEYRAYSRDHRIDAPGKSVIPASSDPAFRGDPARWNPEELLVASLSSCHMLWFLHLAGAAGLTVTRYRDQAEGVMIEEPDGGGRFERVTLRPRVDYAAPVERERGDAVHAAAHAKCFVARSVSFPVVVEPVDTGSERP